MITNLAVSGYRLLDGFAADLGQLTVVIGANATGKSTLLDCLRFISQAVEYPLQEVLDWHGGALSLPSAHGTGREISWKLTFQKPIDHPYWSSIPLEQGRRFVYEVRVTPQWMGSCTASSEVLRHADPDPGDDDPLKLIVSDSERSLIFDHSQHQLVPFDDVLPASGTDAPTQEGGQDPLSAGLEEALRGRTTLRLARMRFFNEYPNPSWIRVLLASCAFYPGFDVGRSSALRTKPAEVRAGRLLEPTGDNLGMVLHEILTRHDHRAMAAALIEFLRSAYPSFEGVTAETAEGTPGSVMVRVREAGIERAMETSDLSDGVLRFLCLAAALLNPIPPALVCVDEPETGLHPRLLPIVADMIKTAAERTQVVVTTHSPDLLNCFDLDDVAVMAREESQIVWHRPATRGTLRNILEPVAGETLGDLHRSGELEELA